MATWRVTRNLRPATTLHRSETRASHAKRDEILGKLWSNLKMCINLIRNRETNKDFLREYLTKIGIYLHWMGSLLFIIDTSIYIYINLSDSGLSSHLAFQIRPFILLKGHITSHTSSFFCLLYIKLLTSSHFLFFLYQSSLLFTLY